MYNVFVLITVRRILDYTLMSRKINEVVPSYLRK